MPQLLGEEMKTQCAICAETCAEGQRVSVQLALADGDGQQFFVHWQCLRGVLNEDCHLLDVDGYEQGIA